jgi:hypothetical protein
MRDIPLYCQTDRLERDRLTLRVLTVGYGLGAWVAVKKVVEATILLNDDNDVLDLFRAREWLERRLARLPIDDRYPGR